jgi:hypothetical protein
MGDPPRNLHRDDDEERLARADAIIEERLARLQQGRHLTAARPPADSGKAPNAAGTVSTISARAVTQFRRAPRKGSPRI